MAKKASPIMIREPGGPTRIDLRKLSRPDADRLGRTLLPLVRQIWEEEQEKKWEGETQPCGQT